MNTPLNKAFMPNNKDNKKSLTKASRANTEMQEIAEIAEAIEQNKPGTKKQLMDEIGKAQEDLQTARKEKEEATTEAAFNAACEHEYNVQQKIIFLNNKLEHIKFTPCMEEAEYNKHVNTIKTAVETAGANFKKVAEKAMQEIIDAQAAYMAIVNEADDTLIKLDRAANVLQSKYRYHLTTFVGEKPPEKKEDPSEWKRHALRYGTGKAKEIVTKNGNEWNFTTAAAWRAAETVTKE